MRVFLSYRRGDVGGYAGRLHDDLVPHLGPRNVFQDVTAIGAGLDYTEVIDRHLRTAKRHPDGTTDRLLRADRDRPY